MSSLKDIPIQVNQTTIGILPLLYEIHHALTKLLKDHEDTLIDLRNLPLSSQEKQSLLNTLGKGEISAELNALGRSLVWETQFAGVWVVEHYSTEEVLLSQTVEITQIPTILKSPLEDVQAGLERLEEQLSLLKEKKETKFL